MNALTFIIHVWLHCISSLLYEAVFSFTSYFTSYLNCNVVYHYKFSLLLLITVTDYFLFLLNINMNSYLFIFCFMFYFKLFRLLF